MSLIHFGEKYVICSSSVTPRAVRAAESAPSPMNGALCTGIVNEGLWRLDTLLREQGANRPFWKGHRNHDQTDYQTGYHLVPKSDLETFIEKYRTIVEGPALYEAIEAELNRIGGFTLTQIQLAHVSASGAPLFSMREELTIPATIINPDVLRDPELCGYKLFAM